MLPFLDLVNIVTTRSYCVLDSLLALRREANYVGGIHGIACRVEANHVTGVDVRIARVRAATRSAHGARQSVGAVDSQACSHCCLGH